MYEENRYEYTVRTCSCEDSQSLENLLNEMSITGWELYSLNEVETEDEEFHYLCIFNRKIGEGYESEDDDIINVGDFKTRMKRLMHKKDDLYKECRFLQQHIKEKNLKIQQIKDLLDSGSEEIDREELNKEISERMTELSSIKSKFSELLSPSNMYSRISQDLLTITVSHELSKLIDNEKDGDLIAESVRLRQKLTDKLGFVIPRIHFTTSDEINENEYRINVRNMKSLTNTVYPGYRRFFIGQSNLENIPEDAIEDIDPFSEQQVFWLEEDKTKDFWDKGLTPSQVIISHLELIVRKYISEIISYGDILDYISLLGEENSFLAEELMQESMSLGDLRYIFANLIREKVPVKDVVFIFEKLNDLSEKDYDNEKLLEELRILLKRQICSSVANSDNTIYAITIPKKFKKLLFESKKEVNKKKHFKDSEYFKDLINYVSNVYLNSEYGDSRIVLITEPEYRLQVFNLFEQVLPDLTVLSEDEIVEEFNIEEI